VRGVLLYLLLTNYSKEIKGGTTVVRCLPVTKYLLLSGQKSRWPMPQCDIPYLHPLSWF